MGPKVCRLYLHDIHTEWKKLNLISFADDTNLLCSGPDMKVLLKTVEKELMVFKEWFDSNKLS